MPRKPRFKPEIRRVKLNPEQAVLACACVTTNNRPSGVGGYWPPGSVIGNACSTATRGSHPVHSCGGSGPGVGFNSIVSGSGTSS